MTSWVPFDLLDHLWQSTLFAAAVWLVARAVRTNAARVRYWLWFAASMKFLVPVSLLVSVGERFAWRTTPAAAPPVVSFVIEQVLTPAAATVAAPAVSVTSSWLLWPVLLLAAWGCGVAFVLAEWWRQWQPIRRALRDARAIDIGQHAGLTVLASASMIEPGVFGIWRPVLLVPDGIRERLTEAQLRALIAHEQCHVRHHDNFTAALHMAIEALFWFHPLVWWLERRLIEERERACDEYVLQSGSTPRDYAEGILEVCRFAKQPPPAFVAGVSGSDLKRRIQLILRREIGRPLGVLRAVALGVCCAAVVVAPVVVGALPTRPQGAASARANRLQFDVASIKLNRNCGDGPIAASRTSPGRLSERCMALESFIQAAYVWFENGRQSPTRSLPLEGGPAWVRSDLYEITATAEGAPSQGMMRGPMMRALLEDRFKLKVRKEVREVAVYALAVAKGGSKLKPFAEGSCIALDFENPGLRTPGQPPFCRTAILGPKPPQTNATIEVQRMDLNEFSKFLALSLERRVIDKTGISGVFDFHLEFIPDPATRRLYRGENVEPTSGPSLFTALEEQLGLKLESARGPGEFLVIDGVERPAEN